jgi:hypothetical protein
MPLEIAPKGCMDQLECSKFYVRVKMRMRLSLLSLPHPYPHHVIIIHIRVFIAIIKCCYYPQFLYHVICVLDYCLNQHARLNNAVIIIYKHK